MGTDPVSESGRWDAEEQAYGKGGGFLEGRFGALLRRAKRAVFRGRAQGDSLGGNGRTANSDRVRVRKAFPGFRVEMEMENRGEGKAVIRVHAHGKDAGVVRATLMRNGREVSSSPLEGASAVFEEVALGRYVLVFTRNGQVKGAYPFEIKETRHDRGRKRREGNGSPRH